MTAPPREDLPDRTAVTTSPPDDERTAARRRADLVADLKSLRRGRAIFTSRIGERVGATLRGLAGVVDDDGPAEIRAKVARHLRGLAEALPDDLRIASLTAFAIEPGSRHRLYQDRVALTAERIRRDPRTARRRIDEAIEHLAQIATAKPGFGRAVTMTAAGDWWLRELRMSLALDRSLPELVEQGHVVADRHDVGEIEVQTYRIGTFAGQLTSDVFYGGTLRPPGDRPDGHPVVLGLPRALASGESHEYVMRSTVRPHSPLPKQIRFRPNRRCDRFDLRVRFDLTDPPRRVRPIDDETRQLWPDDAGDVRVEFTCLSPERDYGLRWE
jgi:hypothetical protein